MKDRSILEKIMFNLKSICIRVQAFNVILYVKKNFYSSFYSILSTVEKIPPTFSNIDNTMVKQD